MNRLIIIGNGFDLAHGMKTSYNDFLLWYLKKSFKKAYDFEVHEDDLCIINFQGQGIPAIEEFKDVKKFISYDETPDIKYSKIDNALILDYIRSLSSKNIFRLFFKHSFLKLLFSNCSTYNWVDIEIEYYKYLKELVKLDEVAKVRDLNNSFHNLKHELEQYLNEITIPALSPAYDEIFKSNFDSDFISLTLDFNYTNTIKHYFDAYPWKGKAQHIRIHGELKNTDNPIIFGYGDEMDEDYKMIELKNEKEYLKYFKAYGYAKTTNYHKLISHVEAEDFEVLILGHSCGLSDRVMLNTIFENKNCKSIKIYYYDRGDNTNDFIDVYQNISRQFNYNSRADFRKKVQPFDESVPLLQYKSIK